jgi:hypothetical protein
MVLSLHTILDAATIRFLTPGVTLLSEDGRYS